MKYNNNKSSVRILSILFALSFVFYYASGQDYAKLNWEFVPDLNEIGLANFVEYDIDNDGDMELIYSSSNYSSSIFKILDYQNGQFKTIYTSSIFDDKINWIEKYDLDGDGNFNLYIAKDNSTIEVFDLNILSTVDTIDLGSSVEKFFFVDTDGNNSYEIITYGYNAIYKYDSDGNELDSKNISYLNDIVLGDVDGDGEQELVVSGGDGYVINLSDFSEEWAYLGGFGKYPVLHDIDNSGKELIFAAKNYDFVTCYDGALRTPLWQIDAENEISKIEVFDLDGDGNVELLVGEDYESNGIRCYSLSDQTLLWQKNVENRGVTDFSFIDFEGDGNPEIAYGCGHFISSEDLLVIFDPVSLTTNWISTDFDNGFIFDIGDYNDDDVSDYFISSRESNSGYDGGIGYIFDGLTKDILDGPFTAPSWYDLKNVSILNSNGSHYLLYLYDSRIIIQSNGSEIVNEYLGSSYIKRGGFEKTSDDGDPQLVLCFSDGSVKIYDFIDNVLSETWSSIATGSVIYDYLAGNFDNDEAWELALLSNNIITVYDLETHYLEKQFSLSSSSNVAFTIADINADGTKDVLFKKSYGTLGVIDYETSEVTDIPINSNSIRAITTENLDENTDLEIIILSPYELSIYDNEGTTLFTSQTINSSTTFPATLKVADIDHDQHMEIAVATRYGFFEFRVTDEYFDIILPRVKSHIPLDGESLLSTNTTFEVVFSEEMNTDSIDENILIYNESGDALPFSTNFITEDKKLLIFPQPNWTANQQITITIQSGMTDLTGNPLDGNANGIQDGADDDFSWTVNTGSGIDETGPHINNLSVPDHIFKGASIEVTGYATDSSDVAVSPIAYIEYFLDGNVVAGSGVPLNALDETFDEITEQFMGTISTSNLDYGDHTISVIAKDALNNWGEIEEIDFNIIEESPGNWTSYGYDLLNTSANPYSEFTLPLKTKYEFDHAGNYNIKKSIVVEDFCVYSFREFSNGTHKVFCRNLETGEIVWQKDFDISDDIYPAAYAYGYVYLQLGDHSNSKLGCYDINTGEEIWITDYRVQWMDAYGPMVYQDIVYINQEGIGAYNAYTGELIWEYDIGGLGEYDEWMPAIYNDTLYAYSKNLVALNPHTGGVYYTVDDSVIPFDWSGWSIGTNTVVDSTNRQLFVTTSKYLTAFSIDEHSVNWTKEANGDKFLGSPALYDGKLYVTSSGYFSEYDPLTGNLIWRYEFSSPIYSNGSTPVVNDYIFAISTREDTYIFDRNSRELLTHIPKGGNLVLSENYLVLSTRTEGKLIVFEHEDSPTPMSGTLVITNPLKCYGDADGEIRVDVTGGSGSYTYEWTPYIYEGGDVITELDAGTRVFKKVCHC